MDMLYIRFEKASKGHHIDGVIMGCLHCYAYTLDKVDKTPNYNIIPSLSNNR